MRSPKVDNIGKEYILRFHYFVYFLYLSLYLLQGKQLCEEQWACPGRVGNRRGEAAEKPPSASTWHLCVHWGVSIDFANKLSIIEPHLQVISLNAWMGHSSPIPLSLVHIYILGRVLLLCLFLYKLSRIPLSTFPMSSITHVALTTQ